MEIERRIFRSTSILFLSNLVSQLANFGFVILFARAYGPALLGEYSFALSLGSLLAIFVSLGANGLLLRKCSRDPTHWQAYAGLVFPSQILLAIATWLIAIGVAALVGIGGSELRIIAVVAAFQLLNPIWTLFAIGFTATERMGYTALADAGGRILILLVGSFAIWLDIQVELVLIVFPASNVLVLIVLARLASAEFGRPQLRINLTDYVALIREALPFFGIVALAVVYSRLGILLLRATNSPGEVGQFASAERLVMAACILHATFSQAIYPAFVRLIAEDQHRFHQLVNRCTRLILVLTLPTATVLHLFANDLIGFLFGDHYGEASNVLRILAWLIGLRGITAIANNIAIASDHQRLVVISNLTGILVLVMAAVALTPSRGALGLAVAAVLAQAVKSTLIFVLLRPSGRLPNVGRISFSVVAACAGTVALAAAISNTGFLLRSTSVLVVGTALLFIFRAIRRQDLVFFHEILSTRSRADD